MSNRINVKNEEAVRLMDELKALTGKGATEILLEALRIKLERHRKSQPK